MQVDSRLLDDLARVAGGAVGTLVGVRGEVEAQMRQRLERALAGMDLVSREEFETVRAMAAQARTAQEESAERGATIQALEARIARLEAQLATLTATTPSPTSGAA